MARLNRLIRIRPRNICHDLILGLFYPAVLGAIFYSFLSSFADYKNIWPNVVPLLGIIAILFHFTADFVQTSTARKYTAVTFLLDLVGLLLLYLAFHFVDYSVAAPKYNLSALCLALLYVCYLLFDIETLREYRYFTKTLVSCAVVGCGFFFLWAIRTPGWALVVLLVIASFRLLWLILQDIRKPNLYDRNEPESK